jgi:hypothetical protein
LFCNAGILLTNGLNWKGIARDIILNPKDLFCSGSSAFHQPVGLISRDGFGEVFVCNIAGHYLLVWTLRLPLS